jgi:type III secretory pathway component EscV
MTMRYLLPILMLAGCGPIPVQMQSSKQEQRQSNEQKQSNEQTASTAADQQSAHQSEAKQGTNSMPIIIICNSNNSPNANCAAPREGGVLEEGIGNVMRKKTK